MGFSFWIPKMFWCACAYVLVNRVDEFREIMKLQNICCYYLTNLRLIQRTRSNDHFETVIKALLYKTYRQRVDFDTFWSIFNWSTFWHWGSKAAVFWPTTFRACIERGMIGPYSALQPYVAGKSDFEVSGALQRLYSVKTRLIMTTICVCLLLSVSEVHTKTSAF